jgi:hypothetical protein
VAAAAATAPTGVIPTAAAPGSTTISITAATPVAGSNEGRTYEEAIGFGLGHHEIPGSKYGLSGLVILFLFFVAVSGLMAYVGQRPSTRGMPILSIGAIKVVAAAWLLGAAYVVRQDGRREIAALELALLVTAVWIVFLSHSVPVFFGGLLLLEIALNGSSARLQSAVVGAAPRLTGQWLNGVILLGTAIGPPLYGLAIAADMEAGLLVLSSVVICSPLVWQAYRR